MNAPGRSSWSYEQAERYLATLEPFGWNFGLDRIRRLTAALGNPQHRFAAVHVVGTNGKSSVAAMTAALLRAHGMRAGAYLSPHVERWSERVLVDGAEISPDAFAAAVERVAEACGPVSRTLEPGDFITEFEVVTAAAFVALASAGVEVGVIEAGLGGRLDATNVLASRVAVLTSVGLEHTQWLGSTAGEIATEKLAVLRDHSTLVVGHLDPEIDEIAVGTAAARNATLIRPEASAPRPGLAAPYLERNFAVAVAAAAQLAGPLDRDEVAGVAAALELPGRMQALDGDPPLILDAAHNPDGARALAEALAAHAGGPPVIACLAILADKDAAGMLDALAPAAGMFVCTEIPAERLARGGRTGSRTVPAAELAALATAAAEVQAIPDTGRAVERTLALARERSGVALFTGSHYLLGYAAGSHGRHPQAFGT